MKYERLTTHSSSLWLEKIAKAHSFAKRVALGIRNVLSAIGIIKMTAENIAFMRTSYQSAFIYFIEQNISDYITKVIEEELLTYDELLKILSLDIEDNLKIDLISHTHESIHVIH